MARGQPRVIARVVPRLRSKAMNARCRASKTCAEEAVRRLSDLRTRPGRASVPGALEYLALDVALVMIRERLAVLAERGKRDDNPVKDSRSNTTIVSRR